MSSSHRPSGDVDVTTPTTGAPITRNDGAGSTRNCEETGAVHMSQLHTTRGNVGQESHMHMQILQGKEGRKTHTNRMMVDKERKLDSGSNGEDEGMEDVRNSTVQLMRNGKDDRANDMKHTWSESTRRSTRAKPQRNSCQDDGCAMRKIEGRLCLKGCRCGNGLPLNTSVIMCTAQGQQGVGLQATESIAEDVIIAHFGQAVAISDLKLVHEMDRIRNELDRKAVSSNQPQYTLKGQVLTAEDDMEPAYVVPSEDIAAWRTLTTKPALRAALSQQGSSDGVGHLANHCCCQKHRNAKLEMVMGTSAEDRPLIMVVVRATRNISPGEEVLVSYTGRNSAENLWFECTCCLCAGECRAFVQARNNTKQQPRMKMDMSQSDSGQAKQSSANRNENTVGTSGIQGWLHQTHRQKQHMPRGTPHEHPRGQPLVDAHTGQNAHRENKGTEGNNISLQKSQHVQWWLQEIRKEVDRTPVDLTTRLLPGTRVEWKRKRKSGTVKAVEKEQITVVLRTSDGKVEEAITNRKNLQVIQDRIDVGEGVRLCLSTLAKMRQDKPLNHDVVKKLLQLTCEASLTPDGSGAPGRTPDTYVLEPHSAINLSGNQVRNRQKQRLAAKKRVILPMHVPGHWFLVTIYPQDGRITYQDSYRSYSEQYMKECKGAVETWANRAWTERRWTHVELHRQQQEKRTQHCGILASWYALCDTHEWTEAASKITVDCMLLRE